MLYFHARESTHSKKLYSGVQKIHVSEYNVSRKRCAVFLTGMKECMVDA